MPLSRNELEFDIKFPGLRKKIIIFLTRELRNLKIIGFPDYDLMNIAKTFTRNIINLLYDDPYLFEDELTVDEDELLKLEGG